MKRLIGYGTTNSSGVATLTNGYTGKGVGKIDIQAELHDDSSVVSQPYEVIDAVYYDHGYSGEGNYNSTGWSNSNCTLTREDYTQLVHNGSGSSGAYYRSFTDSADLCIEFDLYFLEATNDYIFNIADNWTVLASLLKSNLDLVEETWQHIIIRMKNGQGTITTSTYTGSPITFTSTGADRFIWSLKPNDMVRYRDFMVYPI